jgi:hypothetical protein
MSMAWPSIDLSWLAGVSPWVQGLFGGAGATLLWEGVIKPAKDRRSLAHVLAEEVSHNIQYAASARSFILHDPKRIPGDFSLSTMVFSSVADRLGELPELVNEIVLLYRRTEELNRLPETWAEALREYRLAREGGSSQTGVLETELASMLGVYESGLTKYINQANLVLPKLRRAAIPVYRPDLRLRKPRYRSIQDIDADVAQLAEQRRREAVLRPPSDERTP